jgi:hypothetical protein
VTPEHGSAGVELDLAQTFVGGEDDYEASLSRPRSGVAIAI